MRFRTMSTELQRTITAAVRVFTHYAPLLMRGHSLFGFVVPRLCSGLPVWW
jgi:hypothetical protein